MNLKIILVKIIKMYCFINDLLVHRIEFPKNDIQKLDFGKAEGHVNIQQKSI